jgi:tRNA A37 threonylcarbamoyladenosine dehydratase
MKKKLKVLVRISSEGRIKLWDILFRRYPKSEWGTFIRIGWRESALGLVLTLQSIDEPEQGDLEEDTWITEIRSSYTRKIIRKASSHPYGIGFVHSHPEGYQTFPSESDLDMENYYSQLFSGYAPNRPFASLIFSKNEGSKFSGSGRVWWKSAWHEVSKFAIENCPVSLYNFAETISLREEVLARMKRFTSAFTEEAAELLADATVGIVGVSGTGSPVAEILGRSNIGNLIVIDPKFFEDSNHERNHASMAIDLGKKSPKVQLTKRHIQSINPNCNVIAIQGSVPQAEVIDYLLWADIVVGCTDLHSARIALTDLSTRYLLPIIDVGVKMEGENGTITGQVIQINRLFPDDACAYCRRMVSSKLATQELMSDEDKKQLQGEAARAKREGREPNAYWIDTPQLNTVGYLTTMAGGMISAYVIGFLTGRFAMNKDRIELCLSEIGTTVVERNSKPNERCTCLSGKGCADQDPLSVLSSVPQHWTEPKIF